MNTNTTTKEPTLQFIDEIDKVNLLEEVYKIQDEISEYNNFDYELSFGGEKNIIRLLKEEMEDIDFYTFDYTNDFGFYWCGILTDDPFSTLEMEEEHVLNLITRHHLRINPEGIIEFYNPTTSPLYRFFLQNRDGSGGNISYSVNAIIRKIKKVICKEFKDDRFIELHGTWIESGYCPDCECYYCVIDGRCPDCNEPLEYS